MITLIQIVLIVVLAYLIKSAKKIELAKNYIFVLVGGLVTFLSVPLLIQADGAIDTGVQLAAEIFGIFSIIWSIVKMIKGKKKDKLPPPVAKTE
jgi:hypothetical protein